MDENKTTEKPSGKDAKSKKDKSKKPKEELDLSAVEDW